MFLAVVRGPWTGARGTWFCGTCRYTTASLGGCAGVTRGSIYLTPVCADQCRRALQHPTGLGIVTGLILGKFIGFSGACWLGLRYKIGCIPDGVNLKHVIEVFLIAGIGFTMSTFIATMGFGSQPVHLQSAKSSILVASLISAILGVLYIRFVAAKKQIMSLNSTPKGGANEFNR